MDLQKLAIHLIDSPTLDDLPTKQLREILLIVGTLDREDQEKENEESLLKYIL